MNKFQRSWFLLKSSLSIIGRNKLLLAFPIGIFACTSIIVLFFLAPPLLRPTGYSYVSSQHWQTIYHSLFSQTGAAGQLGFQVGFTPGAMAYLAFLYFVSMFVATFLNVAFFHEILGALSGQPVSIENGLKFAVSRWKAIALWTLFAGLVGLLIKTIEQRLELVGRIIARLLGLAWSVAAVFVIPVIVREEKNANPMSALRTSCAILKRTWGEALIGYVGLSFANVLILISSLFILGCAVAASIVLQNFWVILFGGILWVLVLFAWSYLASVAGQVYKGALYLYAAEGIIAQPYTQEMLDRAWKFKKS